MATLAWWAARCGFGCVFETLASGRTPVHCQSHRAVCTLLPLAAPTDAGGAE